MSQSHIFLSEESELQTQNKIFGQLNDRDKQTWEGQGAVESCYLLYNSSSEPP